MQSPNTTFAYVLLGVTILLNLIACWIWRHAEKLRRGRPCPKQEEIRRLRRVLWDIADSRPDQYMDIEKTPELTEWICSTCRKASLGVYPPMDGSPADHPSLPKPQSSEPT